MAHGRDAQSLFFCGTLTLGLDLLCDILIVYLCNVKVKVMVALYSASS